MTRICYTDTPLSQDASTHQIWNPYLKEYKRYAKDTIILKIRSRQQWPKMVCDTLSSKDAFTNQIWNSYFKEYRRYAPDSIQFLKTRPEVKLKVTVTLLWYATLRHPKMHPHTQFEIPTSNNIRDVPCTWLFLKLGQKSKSQWPENGTRHSVILRCIHTPNSEFLRQRI